MLSDPQKRAALLDTLDTISKAAPAAGAPMPPPAPVAAPPVASAAATPVVPAAAAKPVDSHLKANSLVGQLLLQASHFVSGLSSQLAATGRTMSDFPALSRWVVQTLDTPAERDAALDAIWKLGAMFLAALAAEFVMSRLLRRSLNGLASHMAVETPAVTRAVAEGIPAHNARRSWKLLQRLPIVLLYLVLSLLPIAVFIALGNLLPGLGLIDSEDSVIIFLAIVNAYALAKIILIFSDALFAPGRPQLRLIGMSDENAAYTAVWIRRLVIVSITGLAIVEVGELLGMNEGAHDALQKLVILIVHICLVIIVLQNRDAVGNLIRRAWRGHGVVELLLGRFAAVWHFLAIAIIMGLWVVWAAELRDGYARFLHFFFVTCAVLFVARLIGILVLGGLDHGFRVDPAQTARHPDLLSRVNRYYPLLRGTITGILVFTAGLALLQIWGIDTLAWFEPNKLGSRILSVVFIIAITLLVAITAWEMVTTGIDQQIVRLEHSDQGVKLARLRTLQPILKTALLCLIFVMAGLTILSEVGINIAPLLAGAGIVGVAIGFGSQKLVQDFITGIFLLMENAMQVGDNVTVAGLSGSVEHLSIRTIRLRAGDGSVHIIPFSSVTTVNNSNRGMGNAAVSVNVSYTEDTDRVGAILKEIGAELRAEPAYQEGIRDDLQLWGVDKIDGAVVTVVGQIPCTDSARWGVQREFNRRMKKRFEELGIEIGIPAHSVVINEPSRSRRKMPEQTNNSDPGETSATVVESPPPSALGNKD